MNTMDRGQKKEREGIVISDKMDKTVVVLVERSIRHPLFQKVMRRAKKYKAHNEGNIAKVGNIVRIAETRPISKDKRWRVVQVVGEGSVKKKEENA